MAFQRVLKKVSDTHNTQIRDLLKKYKNGLPITDEADQRKVHMMYLHLIGNPIDEYQTATTYLNYMQTKSKSLEAKLEAMFMCCLAYQEASKSIPSMKKLWVASTQRPVFNDLLHAIWKYKG